MRRSASDLASLRQLAQIGQQLWPAAERIVRERLGVTRGLLRRDSGWGNGFDSSKS